MSQSDPGERAPWWKGSRGEWYVVAQAGLFVLVAFGPRTCVGLPRWPCWLAAVALVAGIALVFSGGGLLLAAFAKLGRNLTPLPFPKAGGELVVGGAYRVVRHPIYAGGSAAAFGWALCVHGPLTFGYAGLLFILFDLKSRREERWLAAKFPAYVDYQKRVHRLIPFVY